MTLRDLLLQDIIFFKQIEQIHIGYDYYYKDLERFLDYEVSNITPYTHKTFIVRVKKPKKTKKVVDK